MEILATVISYNFRKIIDLNKDKNRSIFSIIIILLSIFVGVICGIVFQVADIYLGKYSQKELLDTVVYGFIYMTILRGFIPSYNSIARITNPIHPINKVKRFLINVTFEVSNLFFITSVIFLTTFSVFLSENRFSFLVISILGLGSAHLCRRIIHLTIEYKQNLVQKILILVSGFAIYLCYKQVPDFLILQNMLLIFCLLLFANISMADSFDLRYTREHKIGYTKLFDFSFVKLFFKNKTLRSTFIFEISTKLALLIFDYDIYSSNGHHFGKYEHFIVFFLSPVSLFTYYFNNIFGFSRQFWYSLFKTGASFSECVFLMSKFLGVPILVHLSLVVPFYVISESLVLFSFQFYFCCLLTLLPLSIYFSVKYPKKVERALQKGGNVSAISNLTSMLLVIAFIFVLQYLPQYLILICSVTSFVSVLLARSAYSNSNRGVYEVLYK